MAKLGAECDQIIDYFNGHLSQAEKEAFEHHLEHCPECQAELAEWNALIEDLPYDSEPVSPPEGMKERVLTAVFAEESSELNTAPAEPALVEESKSKSSSQFRRSSAKWALPAAAALLLSLGGNAFLYNELQQQSTELSQTQDTVDELLQYVTLSPTGEAETSPAATASIVRTGSEVNVVINASSLGPLANDEVYQVWLIEGESPKRAGTFVASESGAGAVVFTLDEFNSDQWNQIAISHEPDAQSETPEGEVILASEL
ncbi:anti-sigma factor [Jeotgalibacillus sp. ET6]|uniref:anti-sigma factor n=1 Tax=Jeotgalibacillus sp. ET6 TaxID=3037260 RepID=UPI0024188188|nr:anti-sigma factor [Jeotgalibacillus sp. ET6]MDG5473298.1 anti-sigma factor [Jeotgalibacillus sp. ET6]